jgi:hypothetical protein
MEIMHNPKSPTSFFGYTTTPEERDQILANGVKSLTVEDLQVLLEAIKYWLSHATMLPYKADILAEKLPIIIEGMK